MQYSSGVLRQLLVQITQRDGGSMTQQRVRPFVYADQEVIDGTVTRPDALRVLMLWLGDGGCSRSRRRGSSRGSGS